jgi:hypothetical protein
VCLLSIFPFFNIKVRVRVNVRFRARVRVMVKLRVRFHPMTSLTYTSNDVTPVKECF